MFAYLLVLLPILKKFVVPGRIAVDVKIATSRKSLSDTLILIDNVLPKRFSITGSSPFSILNLISF